jgi:hypothetical protein
MTMQQQQHRITRSPVPDADRPVLRLYEIQREAVKHHVSLSAARAITMPSN